LRSLIYSTQQLQGAFVPEFVSRIISSLLFQFADANSNHQYSPLGNIFHIDFWQHGSIVSNWKNSSRAVTTLGSWQCKFGQASKQTH